VRKLKLIAEKEVVVKGDIPVKVGYILVEVEIPNTTAFLGE